MTLNWIDAGILGLIALSALIGLGRGLVRELLSLVIWSLALLLAWRLYPLLEPELAPWLPGDTSRAAAAYLLTALGLVMVGGLVGYLLTSLVELGGLGGTSRLLGALFGLVRGALIIAMLAFLGALTPVADQAVWQDSRLIGRFQVLAERVLAEVPPQVEDRVRTL
ncbi:MAG: CvpA family protein [Chromatiaceae bacterium]